MNDSAEILLRVEHLCQYFKLGAGQELRAVDDVSFEIRKGEVFGLVGESGCGRTTTGRSVIKLYDITSGNIYFKGHRICAGTRAYSNAVTAARREYRASVAEIKRAIKSDKANGKTEVSAENAAILKAAEEKYKGIVADHVSVDEAMLLLIKGERL